MTDEDPTEERTSCPVCGAEAVPIVYGYATSEMAERVDRGEVVLGGCVVGLPDGDPSWACLSCRTRFRAPRDVYDARLLKRRPRVDRA